MKNMTRRTFIGSAVAASMIAAGCNKEKAGKSESSLKPVTGKVIDAHMHLHSFGKGEFSYLPDVVEKCFRAEDENFIKYALNIGVAGDRFFLINEKVKQYRNRLGMMYAFDWDKIQTDPDFFQKAPDLLEKAVDDGALGVKCFKDLGLTVRDKDGSLLRIDDERLFPVWKRAEELGVIVSFHTTDPVAFFSPWNPENERWKELELHPEWSFADRNKFPERDALLEQRDNVIRNFPGVKFHGCHAGNNSEDIDKLSERLDSMPNLTVDIAARLGELGRHPADKGHDFFTRFQDRIMFGTDHMFHEGGDVQGAGPERVFNAEENSHFYQTHWRYLQTWDTQFDHPTPIQGDWKIDGIGLDESVLRKIYWDNAYKLYRLDRFGVP